ncbi:hypothetical protein L596_004047 [Steinernema carpocapsae]|uniref:SAM domain-containing protein n=1 Tax=Steinernema carpocapsae TaxID=34508 RepID=A0A4U8UXZ4_STECR|nr:hypothetical protein L596_004047 [Steinernema carpocapsae]
MSLPRLRRKPPLISTSSEEPSDAIYRSATLRTDRKPSVASIRRHSVIAMTSRMGRTAGNGHNTVRQVKKVAIPTIPNNAFGLAAVDLKLSTCSDSVSDSRSTASGDNRVQRPSLLHLPSTSFSRASSQHSGTLSVCSSESSSDCKTQSEYVMRGSDPAANHQRQGNPIVSSYGVPLGAFSQGEIHAQTYHRNSTGSSSSQASSGFESMQSGCLRSSAISSQCNSSGGSLFFPSPSSQSYSSNATSEPCPSSRISMHSDGSESSALLHNSIEIADENPYSGRIARPSSAIPSEYATVSDMLGRGVPEAEILALWLDKMKFSQYLTVFLTQGYDLASIARVTPEDLINLGITDPSHRKLLIADIHTWKIGDYWPSAVSPTDSIREWFTVIGLSEYITLFESQGCLTMRDVENLVWEDFEDIGVKKLGHMKRLTLAIKKLKVKKQENGASRHPQMTHNMRADVSTSSLHKRNPPPPVPKRQQGSNFATGRDIYATFNRSRLSQASVECDGHVKRPIIQVPPTHRKVSVDDYAAFDAPKKDALKKLPLHEFDEPCKPIRLNLYSSKTILSNTLQFEDMTISSHVEEYPPPPPAPLACEGSIRRLQTAFSNGSSSAPYSHDALPFANDNCGTIRSKGERVGTSQPSTPRRCVQGVFTAAPPLRDDQSSIGMHRKYESKLNDDDFNLMIQNLNNELDAITEGYDSGLRMNNIEAPSAQPRHPVMQRKF